MKMDGDKIYNLDRRITIQDYTTVNDFGTETKTWSNLHTVWAGKEGRNVKEMDEAMKETAFRMTTYYIRDLSGLREDMRVIDEYGETHNIIGIEEVGRRKYLRLTLERIE